MLKSKRKLEEILAKLPLEGDAETSLKLDECLYETKLDRILEVPVFEGLVVKLVWPLKI
jgi:hypothetical protein